MKMNLIDIKILLQTLISIVQELDESLPVSFREKFLDLRVFCDYRSQRKRLHFLFAAAGQISQIESTSGFS